MLVDGGKDTFGQFVFLQESAELEQGRGIGHAFSRKSNTDKTPNGLTVVNGVFGGLDEGQRVQRPQAVIRYFSGLTAGIWVELSLRAATHGRHVGHRRRLQANQTTSAVNLRADESQFWSICQNLWDQKDSKRDYNQQPGGERMIYCSGAKL